MTQEVIFETAGDDGQGLDWAYDLIEALQTAQNQCEEAESEDAILSFFVQDQDGRTVKNLKIVKQTSGGLVSHTIVLELER